MRGEFADQIAVVTGAARGLGRACATLLCERGASVYLADLDHEAVADTAKDLLGRGLSAHPVTVDIADEAAVARLRDEIASRSGGRLDVLVNNAGGWRHGSVRDTTLADWDWTFRTNLLGAFVTTRGLMDLMVERGYGRIVNVASSDAHRAKPTLPDYAAAKAALVNLTMTFAEELAPSGVLVNAVSPGAIATETATQQAWFAKRVKTIPVGRGAEPEDIAEVILFLASPRNRYVVGETVKVNGGSLIC
jgi:3-oxoacyl-[acyl-carrier protein] reductase